jgi:uncharacterized membrane protein
MPSTVLCLRQELACVKFEMNKFYSFTMIFDFESHIGEEFQVAWVSYKIDVFSLDVIIYFREIKSLEDFIIFIAIFCPFYMTIICSIKNFSLYFLFNCAIIFPKFR